MTNPANTIPHIIFDMNDKIGSLEKNKLTRAMRILWVKYWYRREATSLWGDMLYYRMWNLHAFIKKQLDQNMSWSEC